MSLKTLVFLILSISSNAFAESFDSTIHSVEADLIRFDNGRVTFIKEKNKALLDTLKQSLELKETVVVKVDKHNNLTSVQSDLISHIEDENLWGIKNAYQPSILKNHTESLSIFKRMRKDFRRSGQCFQKAHIWTYEEYLRSGLNSMKIFMFFTERYIRRYKHKWWFHVTPMFYVGNMQTPRTLDRQYMKGPRSTKFWSDDFVKSKRRCKIVNRFDEFWLNQKTEDCYHIYTSMYFVIPRDIEVRDLTSYEKTVFREKDILRAYEEGFKKPRN